MATLRLGLSYWGLAHDFENHRYVNVDTPDGHRFGRPIFIREAINRGHHVIAMQHRREQMFECDISNKINFTLNPPVGIEPEKFPELDVLFLEWRWKTWKNDKHNPNHVALKYEPDYDRQLELIEYYKDRCPIIAWDTDLKITPDDEKAFPMLILSDPSFKTNFQTRQRVSIPFWTDWRQLVPCTEPLNIYGFVGNNYERPEEFKKFYFSGASNLRQELGIQTAMYGNWLQRSPEREQPEHLIKSYQNVNFNHRMGFYDSMQIMNKFVATTHVAKQKYYETEFMSPRYLEALAVCCPAFTPASFDRKLLGKEFSVGSADDVHKKMLHILKEPRYNIVQEQIQNLKKFDAFDVGFVLDFIESCI